MKIFHVNSSPNGFTLIELLIAMVIGVFLMAGVVQIFISAKQAYKLQENQSRLQENGRFAMSFITQDVRMAGYLGCSRILPASKDGIVAITEQTKMIGNNDITNNWTPTVWGKSTSDAWNAAWTTPGPCGSSNECMPKTDTISFQYAKSCGGNLTTNMTSKGASISISTSNSCSISAASASAPGDQVLIADCNAPPSPKALSDVFVSTSTGNTINHKNELSKAYETDAEVFTFQSISYFLRLGASGSPALFRVDNTKPTGATNPVELVEGIEDIQILYGVDSDLVPDYIPNYYVDAVSVPPKIPTQNRDANTGKLLPTDNDYPGWGRVISIRISLLAVSLDNYVIETPQPYTYNDTVVTKAMLSKTGAKALPVVKANHTQVCAYTATTIPSTCVLDDDLRLHRVFNSTIAVRNRLP
jgi:type IV pilus assembly protein PilW